MIIKPYTKCPKCETIYSYINFLSEKTPGVEFWSDGFCMTQMRKEIIEFAKCSSCNTFFWIQENSVQEPEDSSGIEKLKNSWQIDNISNNEFDLIKAAFHAGLAHSTETEILLRIKLWHAINHILRKYTSLGFLKKIKQQLFEGSEFKESIKRYDTIHPLKMKNLIRLINLLKLDKSENTDNLLFAEIYRELGDFGKASVFCHKAETYPQVDSKRLRLLKQQIAGKNKTAYKL